MLENNLIAILLVMLSAIIGPILVVKYKSYLEKKKKQEESRSISENFATNELVEEELEKIKAHTGVNSLWIAQFHNGGKFYPNGKSITKFSITYNYQNLQYPGISNTLNNIPVSLFNTSLSKLYKDKEILLPNFTEKNNYDLSPFNNNQKVKSFYLFALNSIKGDFVGFMGLEFTEKHQEIKEEQLEFLRNKSITIGAILSINYNKSK